MMISSTTAMHPITRLLSRTWVLLLAILLAYVLAFTNGFRMPNLWSINYFLPSMFEGFYRRSLLGTLLFPLGEWRFNYYTIASIQFTIFIARARRRRCMRPSPWGGGNSGQAA